MTWSPRWRLHETAPPRRRPRRFRDAVVPAQGKEHLRDIARVADEYALCMDSTRACLHYLKARQLPVDRLFDQLGKALVLTQCLSLSMTRS
jgi:hypothetical protein